MSEARYDPVADFYATAFNAVDDPAAAALLDLTEARAGLRILDLACGHVLPRRLGFLAALGPVLRRRPLDLRG